MERERSFQDKNFQTELQQGGEQGSNEFDTVQDKNFRDFIQGAEEKFQYASPDVVCMIPTVKELEDDLYSNFNVLPESQRGSESLMRHLIRKFEDYELFDAKASNKGSSRLQIYTTDRDGMYDFLSIMYAHTLVKHESGNIRRVPNKKVIYAAAQLWEGSERGEKFMDACKKIELEQEERTNERYAKQWDESVKEKQAGSLTEKFNLEKELGRIQTDTVKDQIQKVHEQININPTGARIDEVSWARMEIPSEVGRVYNFIRHLHNKQLNTFDAETRINLMELQDALRVTEAYLEKYPERFLNVGQLYDAMKELEDKNPEKYGRRAIGFEDDETYY